MKRSAFAALACAGAFCIPLSLLALRADAHGELGNRFFPPTISTDDPFAVDEFAFPTLSYTPGRQSRETDAGFEFDKEIFPRFALGLSETYIASRGKGANESDYGWDNLELTAKYELILDEPHEFIFSIGLEADVGGTGDKAVAESYSTFTPTIYFGKGFGDLPDFLDALKPLAITGTLGQSFPTSRRDPNQFQWGFAFEYSLPYLQQHVRDIGLPEPLRNMIPLVEVSLATDENGDSRGITTGTINPGVLYETPYFQIGAEANIPINGESGPHVGTTIQIWIFIDDLFPKHFGHPVFGGDSQS